MTMEDRILTVSRRFAERATQLDQATAARLDVARMGAVSEFRIRKQEHGQPPSRLWIWVPAGVAAALVCGVLASVMWLQSRSQPPATANADDLEIVLSRDNLDMYAELDFYEWLAAQPADEAGNAS